MSRINYSKWDHFDEGNSSDEDGPDANQPRVTALDGPSTVTRSKDGTLIFKPSDESSTKMLGGSSGASGKNKKALVGSSSTQLPKNVSIIESELSTGGGKYVNQDTKSTVFWSQDRYNVIISVPYDPSKLTPKDISVVLKGSVSFSNRFSAVGSGANSGDDKGSLLVKANPIGGDDLTGKILLKGNLPHFVHFAEGEDEVEWEFDSFDHFKVNRSESGIETKMVRITLRKAVPMAGITIWWDQPFKHCPKIDSTKIKGRKDTSQSQAMISWNEAHELFHKRMKEKKKNGKTSINISGI